jgi:UDP-glucose 4-epimerase
MTRFLLSIEEAVDLVIAALQHARPGETYIPLVPSATVENVAKALIGDRPVETKILGIRPGEKIHEILISEEERFRAIKRGDNYVIKPILPELETEDEPVTVLDKEYSSEDHVVSLDETVELLRKHELMIENVRATDGGELLR